MEFKRNSTGQHQTATTGNLKGIVASAVRSGHWKQGRACVNGVDSRRAVKPKAHNPAKLSLVQGDGESKFQSRVTATTP